jgi:DNA helicase-2/ATP-dependent DNA helicase PcrA
MDILAGLDAQQQAVVTSTEGQYVVTAGPGSGKTHALTQRVAYILSQGLARPEEILVMTFTNKAANEIKERIVQATQVDGKSMWVGTFHSVCVKIILAYGSRIGVPKNFTIADEDAQYKEIKNLLGEKAESSAIYNIVNWISKAKEAVLRPDDLQGENVLGMPAEIVEIYSRYQQRLSQIYALDFDDLIMRCLQILMYCADALSYYQRRFKYVMMDECQDSSFSNMKLVKLLSGEHHNLMLIGDSDQAIYAWRGANTKLMLDYARQADVTTLQLVNNYRSRPHIIHASNGLIEQNTERLDRLSQPVREASQGLVNYHRALTPFEEAQFIGKCIQNQIRKHGGQYKDFAVLYRTNAQSRMLEDTLGRSSIPCRVAGRQGFYDKKEIKDAVAYFKLLVNNRDLLAFQRIANEPSRKLGETTLLKIVNFAYDNRLGLLELPGHLDKIPRMQKLAKESLRQMLAVIDKYQGLMDVPTTAVLRDYLYEVGYMPALDEDRLESLSELLVSVAQWLIKEPGKTLADCIRDLDLLTEDDPGDDRVQLLSVHAAKGKEWPCVFVVGVEERLFPHFAASTDQAVEEERRLFYVAMTRAKDVLVLTGVKERGGYGKTYPVYESRFLRELPASQMRRI